MNKYVLTFKPKANFKDHLNQNSFLISAHLNIFFPYVKTRCPWPTSLTREAVPSNNQSSAKLSNFVNVFFLFFYYLPLEMGMILNLNKLLSSKGLFHPWIKEIQLCLNKGLRTIPGGYNRKEVKLHRQL